MTTTAIDQGTTPSTEGTPWRETLSRHQLRALCTKAAAKIASGVKTSKVRSELREQLDPGFDTGNMLARTLPEFRTVIFGDKHSDAALMRHVNYHAAVADTLANDRLVRSPKGTARRDMERRGACLYSAGTLLEDLLAEFTFCVVEPEDVEQLRDHLAGCELTDGDLARMGAVYMGAVDDQQFMDTLKQLVDAFHSKEGIWVLMRFLKIPIPSL